MAAPDLRRIEERIMAFIDSWRFPPGQPISETKGVAPIYIDDLERLVAASGRSTYPALERFSEIVERWRISSENQRQIITRLSARLTEIRRVLKDLPAEPNAADTYNAIIKIKEAMDW